MNGNIPCILCFKFGRIIRGALLVVVIKRTLLKARKEGQTSVLKTVKRKTAKDEKGKNEGNTRKTNRRRDDKKKNKDENDTDDESGKKEG